MNMLHELEVGARIRVSEKELATVKYIGEVSFGSEMYHEC